MIYFLIGIMCLSGKGPQMPDPPETAKGCNGLPG